MLFHDLNFVASFCRTTQTAWDILCNEFEKIAEQHNKLADKISTEHIKNIQNFSKEKQKTRKKLEADGIKLTKDWKAALENLSKVRSKYVALSKDAEAAEAVHTKGKGDMSMKPNQLAKLAQKANQASEKAASADAEYQQTLNLTNQKQTEYYGNSMPALLREFQHFEEERIKFMKETMENFAQLHAEFPSVYTNSCEALKKGFTSVQIDSDIRAFLSENKTGVSFPAEIPYVSWDSEQPGAPKIPSKKAPPTTTLKGKYTSSDPLAGKTWGLTPADQSLSYEEQHSKLSAQLDELNRLVTSETKAKEGLEALVGFYANDPAQQTKAQQEIYDSQEKLTKITKTRDMIHNQLDQLAGGSYDYSQSSSSSSVIKARGLYDYTASNENELSFREGDILEVKEQDDSGWWYCELNGVAGFVPNNYVQRI